MAEKKTDPVDRVMDSVDAFGSKIDELASKVVMLVEKMGPEAKIVFDETLQAYALGGLLSMIIIILTAVSGVGFGVWALVRGDKILKQIEATNKELNRDDKVGDDAAGVLCLVGITSIIIGVIASVVGACVGADLLVRWMHPLGSLILEKL